MAASVSTLVMPWTIIPLRWCQHEYPVLLELLASPLPLCAGCDQCPSVVRVKQLGSDAWKWCMVICYEHIHGLGHVD